MQSIKSWKINESSVEDKFNALMQNKNISLFESTTKDIGLWIFYATYRHEFVIEAVFIAPSLDDLIELPHSEHCNYEDKLNEIFKEKD